MSLIQRFHRDERERGEIKKEVLTWTREARETTDCEADKEGSVFQSRLFSLLKRHGCYDGGAGLTDIGSEGNCFSSHVEPNQESTCNTHTHTHTLLLNTITTMHWHTVHTSEQHPTILSHSIQQSSKGTQREIGQHHVLGEDPPQQERGNHCSGKLTNAQNAHYPRIPRLVQS